MERIGEWPSLIERCLSRATAFKGAFARAHSYLSRRAQRRSLGSRFGVTSKSQNNAFSTNGVNSAMTQTLRILTKIKRAPKRLSKIGISGSPPPSAPSPFHAILYGRESRFYIKYLFVSIDSLPSMPTFGTTAPKKTRM